ncbi:nucleotidyltransferase family protein [Solibacillus sp. FSL R7-0682]|uniref:nucleotidyltransferase family protein n=1 Tax=Solibacillus sp. FSL R7-0682 TaxID=2921690 RepID=UPI0030FA8E15
MLNEQKIIELISKDKWMMDILMTVKSLDLPDWWVCAGFVRSKIWDTLHNYSKRTPIPDIDVIYFDPLKLDEAEEKTLENKLKIQTPNIPWSVKNEARMHIRNNMSPYTSSIDAMSKFPETATALGVKLDENNKVILAAPCGIADVVNLEVKPTPYFTNCPERMGIYETRLLQKNWQSIWPKINVFQFQVLKQKIVPKKSK